MTYFVVVGRISFKTNTRLMELGEDENEDVALLI